METENRTCPNKDLALKMQKEVVCVLKWSQYTVMGIPEEAINHHVQGRQAVSQDSDPRILGSKGWG